MDDKNKKFYSILNKVPKFKKQLIKLYRYFDSDKSIKAVDMANEEGLTTLEMLQLLSLGEKYDHEAKEAEKS